MSYIRVHRRYWVLRQVPARYRSRRRPGMELKLLMSRSVTTPTKLLRPAKTQISMGTRPFWSVFAVRIKNLVLGSPFECTATTLIGLGGCRWKVKLSPRWAHMQFCMFCHVPDQFILCFILCVPYLRPCPFCYDMVSILYHYWISCRRSKYNQLGLYVDLLPKPPTKMKF